MTKPVTIPNTFATATTAIPLSQLDSDFSTVATALNDANTYSNYAADTGVANAYVVTLSGVSTTYSAGLRIQFKAGAANTGASTLNVNGGGTKNITFQDASALSSGTIAANAIVDVMYDGTQFLLMNDPAGATGGDVVGPASATDNAIVRFDGATGKLVQNSVVTIADSTGDVAGVGALTASGNVTLSGGTANGVLYLNGSKVATSGSALTFDGSNLTVKGGNGNQLVLDNGGQQFVQQVFQINGATNSGGDFTFDGTNSVFNMRTLAVAPIAFSTSASAGNPTERMRLTSTGLKSSIAGTNADPVFSYTSDTNTGIFFPAADKLGFTAGGGTDDMVLTTTGLGIGTTSPSTRLHAKGTGGTIATFERDATGTIAYFNRNAGSGNTGAIIGADSVAGYFAGGNNTNNMVYLDSQNNLAQFYTNGSERARITSGGYFKASNTGTYQSSTSSYHELRNDANANTVRISNTIASGYTDAISQIAFTGYSPNTTNSWFLFCNDSTTTRAEIRSNGGLANYQSNNVDLSDIRTKTDINPLASYWNKIAALEIVTYKYKDQTHDDLNIGVIAQQVEQVAPEFVDPEGFGETPEDGVPLKTVYTKDITFAAIKALQEAMARIETLEAKVSVLEGN